MLDPKTSIESVALQGPRIALEPLSAEHLPGLALAILDGRLWEIPVTNVPHPDDLPPFFDRAVARYDAELERPFVTVDLASRTIVGSTRFMNINREHRRVEIGFTFIAQSWQRTYVNTEAKYLMLRHAFETWCCNRVEFITDVLNEKSRAAIRRLGASEEGVLRNHMIMRNGRLRDSVIHSVLRDEWPKIRSRLEAVLAAA
jgi:RimJ/RimL family protein N-acetyltransferase